MPEFLILTSLLISAAASLQAPLEEVAPAFEKSNPGIAINFNFGGSNALARQIENGAPADLLLSAATEPIDRLVDTGLLPSTNVTPFLTNTLALITRSEISNLTDLSALTDPRIKTLAIGEPATAPAGAYAVETLQQLDLLETLRPKFVYAKDVRQVLTWVATGNADAGFVYATDVDDRVHLAATIPTDLHSPIRITAALIRDTPEARRFLEFLQTPATLEVFRTHRFTPLNSHP